MEAVGLYEMFLTIFETILSQNPEDCNLNFYCPENHKLPKGIFKCESLR
jgi:hypothetical protein